MIWELTLPSKGRCREVWMLGQPSFFCGKTYVHDLEQEAESPGSSFPIWKRGMIKALATKLGQIVEG